MANEALQTQLDALCVEKQRLEAENAKLRDGNPEGAAHQDRGGGEGASRGEAACPPRHGAPEGTL